MSSSFHPFPVRSAHVLRGSLVLAATLIASASSLHAQGALTPPGAPAPSMKTLSEIETRIAVQSLPTDGDAQHVITQPGSYYLTGDIVASTGRSGIAIAADGVTLDLGGHSVSGGVGTPRGIDLRGTRAHVVVRNGTIRGFQGGGVVGSGELRYSRIEDLSIVGGIDGVAMGGHCYSTVVRSVRVEGITSYGIFLGNAGTVEHCAVSKCTSSAGISGIVALVVTDCQVAELKTVGISPAFGIQAGNARDCVVSEITNSGGGMATGIVGTITTRGTVSNITGSNGAAGINGTTIDDSTVSAVYSTGVTSNFGINGSQISRCRVTAVGTMAGAVGQPFGIQGTSVIGCTVNGVGTNTTSLPTGISSQLVRDCTVTNVGHTGANSGAVGIGGNVVSNCYLSQVNGGVGGTVLGISAVEVADCSVVTVTGAVGSSAVTAIQADIVSDCRVSVVSGSTASNVSGIAGYRIARNCTLQSLSNTGAGVCYGLQTSSQGRTESVAINANISYGISVTSAHTIVGCVVTNAVTGIQVTGQRCVVEGNNLTGTHTNGIVVTSGSNTANALVIRNQIRNATNNIVADAPAQVGPVVSALGTIASTNPWANFTD